MIPTTGVFDNAAPTFTATISSNQQEMNLATWATGQGWNGTDFAEITIAAGVYVWSDDTAVPAMTTGNFPNGLTLIVNGYIIGKGGEGGFSGSIPAQSGGPALSLGCDTAIFGGANGYIAGGGGGGGGGEDADDDAGAGGGAGGGDGGGSDGGLGGLPGQEGSDGVLIGTRDTPPGSGGGAGGGGSASHN